MTWDEKIKDFENFLRFERNFTDNTLDAYLRDVKKLRDYAARTNGFFRLRLHSNFQILKGCRCNRRK